MDTPCVVVDINRLRYNIEDMASFASSRGLKLRPHIKAHKTVEIAHMQIDAGASGITVSKLGEAEVMFKAGIVDILLAYPLIGPEKLTRARALLQAGCRLSFVVDSVEGAQALSQLNAASSVDVLVEVDSGLERCGLLPGRGLVEYCCWLVQQPGIRLRGILTHAGHVYACSNAAEVEKIGKNEGSVMVAAADSLRQAGIDVEVVSIGATPTVKHGGLIPGVTEIRPGNYVFYDAMQVALGVVPLERCSLAVESTVVSRPTPQRAVIDAGAKVLALDTGAHGNKLLSGHGILPNPSWKLTRLSEEHGIIEGATLPGIGEKVKIVPNHACPVVNLTDELLLSDGNIWQVAARGKTR